MNGSFILGFPGESPDDIKATVRHIQNLWRIADNNPGDVRASVFGFRPYPGTPVCQTLTDAGRDPDTLLAYGDVDLTEDDADPTSRCVNATSSTSPSVFQFGDVPLSKVRSTLATLTREQHERNQASTLLLP
ncbi:hypothetical protein ABZ611_18935 [Streptomyces sp. NPDC007861]|uniref:hypothetical protein n=1 Tax=Streptomyces sp. NPDC007861 TaxID=3154893 RepID=UPI00340FC885